MKKFVMLLLVVLLSLSTIIPVIADATIQESICPKCNIGTVLSSTTYTAWVKTGVQQLCVHGYPYGTDMEYTRTKTTTYECNYCGAAYTTSTKEYKWVCGGPY